MLIEKSAGPSLTGSLPCGRRPRSLDPESVELAASVELPWLLPFSAVAFSAVVLVPQPAARLIASASAAKLRIRALFPPIVPPVRSLPFAVVRAAPSYTWEQHRKRT